MNNRSQIEEIKERLDIAQVVEEYVPQLKRSGRNHFGLCPFHQEHTPSFSVNSELGLFKCFGCGEGGDVIAFLEKVEGVDFPEALQMAADRAGIKLEKFDNKEQKQFRQAKERLLEANTLAAKYFHYTLFKLDAGAVARKYVKGRKLEKEVLAKFQIGFAPAGFENLKKFLLKKGFKEQELVDWGLLVSKNGRVYDKFRKRLMFPIIDHRGNVVGFSGRLIDKDDFGPKYLNSPETLVYKKSKTLYGLYQAKQALRHKDFAILVEGNIDILSSHQAGIENIVAPLGTALTDEQIKLLKRYAGSIYFALDTDAAGEKALLRGLEIVQNNDLAAKAVNIGEYQDVDELITSGGDWKETVEQAQPVIEHLMDRFENKYDLAEVEDQVAYAKELLHYIAKLSNQMARERYLDELSIRTKIDKKTLYSELRSFSQAQAAPALENDERSSTLDDYIKQIEEISKPEAALLNLLYHYPQLVSELDAEQFAFDYLNKVFVGEIKNFLQEKNSEKDAAEAGEPQSKLMQEIIMITPQTYDSEREMIHETKKLINRINIAGIDAYLQRHKVPLEQVAEIVKLKKKFQ